MLGVSGRPANWAGAADASLSVQIGVLLEILSGNGVLGEVFAAAAALRLPDWYVGAGAVAQTVWNVAHDRPPADGIKDYDVAYFDASDISAAAERDVEARLSQRLGDRAVEVDAKNQARVHEWFESRFGVSISPFVSTEAAIATWPTTASTIGVRRDPRGVEVCAPFGLRDLLSLTVRPNRALVTREIYVEKTGRWSRRWPLLQVMPW